MSSYRHMIQYPRKMPETPHLVIVQYGVPLAGIDVSGVSEEGRKQFGDAMVHALETAEEQGRSQLQSELRDLLGAAATSNE